MFQWIDALDFPPPLSLSLLGETPSMTSLALSLTAALALIGYLLGSRRAQACASAAARTAAKTNAKTNARVADGVAADHAFGRRRRVALHSRPSYHGVYVMLWVLILGLGVAIALGLLTQYLYVSAALDAAVSAAYPDASPIRHDTLYGEFAAAAAGDPAALGSVQGDAAREAILADHVARVNKRDWVLGAFIAAAALGAFLVTLLQIAVDFRARNRSERIISVLLAICAAVAIAATVGIVVSVLGRTAQFFLEYPVADGETVDPVTGVLTRIGSFLTGLNWSPLDAVHDGGLIPNEDIGAVPLFTGTLLITGVAMMVAGPIGLMAAIYMSEYASKPARAVGKPLLEILAGVPTVVYGFFAAITVAPVIRDIANIELPLFGMVGLWLSALVMAAGAFVLAYSLIFLTRAANGFRVYVWLMAVVSVAFFFRLLAFEGFSLSGSAVSAALAFAVMVGFAVIVRALFKRAPKRAVDARRILTYIAAVGAAALFVSVIVNGEAPSGSNSGLAAGVVMGIMIIPFVSSLSDDVINATPQTLRDGSLGLGATQAETILNVVLPSAMPGIISALLLGVSRAVGETMIVYMAAGAGPNLTANPLENVTTVTVQIVALITGDTNADTAAGPAYSLALTLITLTLLLNIIALRIVRRYREVYA